MGLLRTSLVVISAIYGLATAHLTWADDPLPSCIDSGKALEINNNQVLMWKGEGRNQEQHRGHVRGMVSRVFPDRNGHEHFEINIGDSKNPKDTIEVIYNQSFGSVPDPKEGMTVEACGDYITSVAQSGAYPPSPSGAIIHWVHRNVRGGGHPDGYLAINGVLYGQGAGGADDNINRGGKKHPRAEPQELELN